MRKNTKFLWIYTGILFSFALILIIFALMTQNSLDRENKQNLRGMEVSVSRLTRENQELKNENSSLKKENEKIKKELENQLAVSANAEISQDISQVLYEALDLFEKGKTDKAREKLQNLNPNNMDNLQKHIYDIIAKQ